ncbi:MAG: hypothetical protein IJ073_02125 [Lachnospiraceae bacterium]|nr:hypothetical protein [Lachnospiraceae bacterium]
MPEINRGRRKPIRKKKSFMFTSRHYSFIGTLGIILAVCSLTGLLAAILISYLHGGNTEVHVGGVGFFGILANITGVIASFISLRERDIYVWVPRTALIINLIDVILWFLLVIWGM